MDAQELTIEAAQTPREKDAIYHFRYQIYAEEYGYELAAISHETKQLRDDLDTTAIQYALKTWRDEIIGTFRINRFEALANPCKDLAPLPIAPLLERVPAEAMTYTSRVMLRADWRGGTALTKMAIRFAKDLVDMGIQIDTCFSSPGLVSFFEQLGYRRFGQGSLIPNRMPYYNIPMLLVLDDHDHLRRVKSPFSRHPAMAIDRGHDHTWINRQKICDSNNHRLMPAAEFWSLVGDALTKPSQNIALLEGFTPEQARELIKVSPILELHSGASFIRPGVHQENLFVVIEGSLEATWAAGERCSSSPAILGPGSVFGETEFPDPKPSSYSIRAKSDAKILILTQTFFQKILRNQPILAANLLKNIAALLSERLTLTRATTRHNKPAQPAAQP